MLSYFFAFTFCEFTAYFMYRSISFTLSLVAFALVALVGCQSTKTVTDKIRSIEAPAVVYKTEVVQGNFVSSEQVAALRAGMPKGQVKNILGTPLLTDIFHEDRWDYVFTIARDGKVQTPRKLTTFFKGEILDRWEGDVMPSEADFVKTLNSGRKLEKVPPLEASNRQLTEFAKRENTGAQSTKSQSTTTVNPQGSAATQSKTYPPLENK